MLNDVSIGPCAVHFPLGGSGPCEAQATRVDRDGLWLDLGGAAGVEVGARVIVEGPWSVRIMGTIAAQEGDSVRVTATRAIEKDRRAAPRAMGGVEMRYAVVSHPSEVDAWMSHAEHPLGGTWYTPDPFMSFSASGLEFEHRAIADAGDVVLVQLSLPGRSEIWRASARVVRVSEIAATERSSFDDDEAAASHRVAIHFLRIGREARDALLERGLEIMRARGRR